MRGEEWQVGMHNEAESVEDDVWASDTRLASRWLLSGPNMQRWLRLMLAFTAFQVITEAGMNILIFSQGEFFFSPIHGPSPLLTFTPLPFFMVVFFLSYALTRRGYSLGAVAGLPLLSVVLTGLVSRTVDVQLQAQGQALLASGDLLPNLPLSWATIWRVLLFLGIPVAVGFLTAKLTRRPA